ncbi:hypothetical protein SRABI27_00411 [Pedobacter sp. Bi27]|nr:hypothetical protein SRABI126_00416 [Pedobacter sp. Bi126]CAH0146457.1 hypothetical protein SRABI27_00411 [Pedobacter sp. Bi27]CAH0212343.1 hypothetical protein SRABI36_02265 [Pedobacter sp. Bi36]
MFTKVNSFQCQMVTSDTTKDKSSLRGTKQSYNDIATSGRIKIASSAEKAFSQ